MFWRNSKMPINSRAKGQRYERAIAHILTDNGYPAHRSQQFCGANGDADITCPDFPFSVECKHVEKLNLYKAFTQAIKDSKGKPPCVIHTKNNHENLITMKFEDFLKLLEQQ